MANAIQDPMDRLSTIIEGEKSPFVELAERMKETSKDVKNLNMSILDLAIALEKRAGVKTDKKDTKEKTPEFRNLGVDLKADLKDFAKGFVSTFTTNSFAERLIGKSEMPANVEKPTISDIEDTVETIKPADNTTATVENKDPLETDQPKELPNQNKILADMVAVLIDLRDDKSQKQLLGEAIAIKKLITDQNNATKLSGGIEPNNEEAKQEDREKLAEAIARKLGEIIGGMGNLGSIVPDVDKDGKKKPGIPPKVPSRGILPGLAGTAVLGYGLSTAGDEPVETGDESKDAIANANNAGVKAIREKIIGPDTPKESLSSGEEVVPAKENTSSNTQKKISTKESLSSGEEVVPAKENKSSNIQKKISTKELKNINTFLNEQQETQKDKLKDAPWYTKMFGIGKEDYLKTLPVQKTKEEEASEWMQRQIELQRTYPNKNTSPKIPAVTPKSTENNVGKILEQVTDKNTEFKMFNIGEKPTQMIAPIISKQTINNTEQTMITNPPSPNSISNSMIRWQDKRSSYTN